MPDIPQSDYGSCIMNMPLIQHQLMTTDEDRAQIQQINQRIKNDIDMARRTDDAKNVSAHQTDFLFYKQSQAVVVYLKCSYYFPGTQSLLYTFLN